MSDVETASQLCLGCNSLSFQSAKFCADCGRQLSEEKQSTVKLASIFIVKAAQDAGHYTQKISQSPMLRSVLNNRTAQKAAAGAAVGAVVATVIPFVTMGMGAIVGGSVVAYRRLLRSEKEK